MPELGILLTPIEESALVEFMLDKGASLVPDINYSSAQYLSIRSLSDYALHRAETRLFFVTHEEYLIAPLEMFQITKGGSLSYRVMQRNGGPTIDFLSTASTATTAKASA